MSQSLIPGFSPYNVPVKPGKRADAQVRVAPEQARAQPQAKTGTRWSEPAVEVRLSREALAFLNGDGAARQQGVAARPAIPLGFAAKLDEAVAGTAQAVAGTAQSSPASARAGDQPHARFVAPGSKVNILV